MTKNQEKINQIKCLKLPVFIWGNGEVAGLSKVMLQNNGIQVAGTVLDIPIGNIKKNIFTKEDLNNSFESYVVIQGFLSVMSLNEKEVKNIFGGGCAKAYSLAELYAPYGIEKMDADYVRKYQKNFEEVYEVLEDEFSKKSFEAYLRAKIEENSSYLNPYVITPQYFFKTDIWTFKTDEILFDAGAFDGDSIRDFLVATNNTYEKIIACEPDKSSVAKLEQYIVSEQLKNISIVNKGISNKVGTLKYHSEGNMMSAIVENGEDEIEVDSIDNILKDDPVTIIKMDIEGYEKEALYGARKVINAYKPMLFISAYHKKDDLFMIYQIIRSISTEYKFYFRIHKPLAIDAVIYAVPANRLIKAGRNDVG